MIEKYRYPNQNYLKDTNISSVDSKPITLEEIEKIFNPKLNDILQQALKKPIIKNFFSTLLLSALLLTAQTSDEYSEAKYPHPAANHKSAVKISVYQRPESSKKTSIPEKKETIAEQLINARNLDQSYQILKKLAHIHGKEIQYFADRDASAYDWGQKYLINGQKVELCADQSKFERGYSLAIDPDSSYYGWYVLAEYTDTRNGHPVNVFLGFWKCTDTGAEDTIKSDGINDGKLRDFDFSFSNPQVCEAFGVQPRDGRGNLRVIIIPPGLLDNQTIKKLKAHKLANLNKIEQKIISASKFR